MALFLGAIAVAHYAAGRYGQAIERSLEAQRLRPGFQGFRRLLCVSLAQAGRIDEARSLLVTIRREQSNLSFAWIRANVPYQTFGGLPKGGARRCLEGWGSVRVPKGSRHERSELDGGTNYRSRLDPG